MARKVKSGDCECRHVVGRVNEDGESTSVVCAECGREVDVGLEFVVYMPCGKIINRREKDNG